MGDFVGQNGGQFRLTFRQADRPGVDHNVSARKGLGVDLGVVNDKKGEWLLAPAAARQVLPQPIDIFVQGLITPWRAYGKDLPDHGVARLGGFQHDLGTAANPIRQQCFRRSAMGSRRQTRCRQHP